MIRRLLGLIILLVSLITIAIFVGGAVYFGQAVDAMGSGIDNVLAVTVDSLETVSVTLEQTKSTIATANEAVDNVAELTLNLSSAVSNTQPLMESMTTVVANDIPNNIEAIQTAIPNVAEVAGVVDTAMTTLSSFGISQTIPVPFNPITLEFDLGIDYEPAEPFDQTILALGDSLEGMPDELRALRGDLEVLQGDMDTISENILTSSDDLVLVNEQIALFIPIMDDYLRIVGQISDSLGQARGQILTQLETAKTVGTVALVFLALTQLAPLYIGWELLSGQRPGQSEPAEVVQEPPPPVPEKVDVEPPVETQSSSDDDPSTGEQDELESPVEQSEPDQSAPDSAEISADETIIDMAPETQASSDVETDPDAGNESK